MSNIFDFRSKAKGASDGDFLKDSDDTVEFGPMGPDVKLSDHFLEDRAAAYVKRDWSNQELANVYRVKKLLDAAGVPNTLERGLSDEGDPWCIFCTVNGDVFIHLCRVDGRYILDSPNLRAPISGVDFADLIANFSGGALRATAQVSKGSRRVVKLHRNGKVFLHPAALLAALIWSIYLNSEDLVMFAPDEALDETAGLDDVTLVNETAMSPLSESEMAEAAHFAEMETLPGHLVSTKLAESAATRDEGLAFKDVAVKSAMVLTPTPIAVGLSSIAIAYGIMSEGFFEAEPEIEVAALDIPSDEPPNETAGNHQDAENGARNNQFDLVAVLNAAFDHTAAEDPLPSALHAELEAGIDLSAILSSMLAAPALVDVPLDLVGAFQESWLDDLPDGAPSAAAVMARKQTGADQKQAVESDKSQDIGTETADVVITSASPSETRLDFSSLFDLKANFSEAFETFDFAGRTVEATFDIASASNLTSDFLVVSTPSRTTPPEVEPLAFTDQTTEDFSEPDTINLTQVDTGYSQTPSIGVLDVNARAFLEFLMSPTKNIEVLSFTQEIILIDFAAIQMGGAETFSMSWTMADGSTVSTIGLKSDFIEFDLIA